MFLTIPTAGCLNGVKRYLRGRRSVFGVSQSGHSYCPKRSLGSCPLNRLELMMGRIHRHSAEPCATAWHCKIPTKHLILLDAHCCHRQMYKEGSLFCDLSTHRKLRRPTWLSINYLLAVLFRVSTTVSKALSLLHVSVVKSSLCLFLESTIQLNIKLHCAKPTTYSTVTEKQHRLVCVRPIRMAWKTVLGWKRWVRQSREEFSIFFNKRWTIRPLSSFIQFRTACLRNIALWYRWCL